MDNMGKTHTPPVGHDNQGMLLGVPGPRVQTVGPAKHSDTPAGQVARHGVAHAPGQQLDGVAGQGRGVGLEVVHSGDSVADDDPEG